MKKIIIALMFLLAVMLARGQEYVPLVGENKVWYNSYAVPDLISHYGIKPDGDTLITQVQYKRVIRYFEPNESDAHIVGYMREDTLKRVYFMNTLFEEGLIYDFSAKKGDTIEIQNTLTTDWWDEDHHPMHVSQKAVVDSIFFIEITPADFRKALRIKSIKDNVETENWIEGIGSMAGVLKSGYHAFCCPWGNHLTCYEENNEIVFKNTQHPYYPSCWYIDPTINTRNNHPNMNGITVFPNPVNGHFIEINFSREFSGYITIYSIKGHKVYSKIQNSLTLETTVELPDIPSGLYIVSFKRITGENEFKKILIQSKN